MIGELEGVFILEKKNIRNVKTCKKGVNVSVHEMV